MLGSPDWRRTGRRAAHRRQHRPGCDADVANAIDSGGVVQARTTATIAARILAPVREVRVSPGDQVRQGQTLIVLDGDDLAAGARAARSAALAAEQGAKAAAAELLAAEAGLALARASHDRIAGLQAKRSATAQELDDATATLRSAEARVAGASARALQAASAGEGTCRLLSLSEQGRKIVFVLLARALPRHAGQLDALGPVRLRNRGKARRQAPDEGLGIGRCVAQRAATPGGLTDP